MAQEDLSLDQRIQELRQKRQTKDEESITGTLSEDIFRRRAESINQFREEKRDPAADSKLYLLQRAMPAFSQQEIQDNLDPLWADFKQADSNFVALARDSKVLQGMVLQHPYLRNLSIEEVSWMQKIDKLIQRPRNLAPFSRKTLTDMAEAYGDSVVQSERPAMLARALREEEEARAKGRRGTLPTTMSPDTPFAEVDTQPFVPRTPEQIEEGIDNRLAKRREELVNIELDRLQNLEDFILGNERPEFTEQLLKLYNQNPASGIPVGASMVGFFNAKEIRDAANAIVEGNATPLQNYRILNWQRLVEATEYRGAGFEAIAADLSLGALEFFGEIGLGGPIGATAKGVIVGTGKEAVKWSLKELGKRAMGLLASSAAQLGTTLAPRIAKGTMERMKPNTHLAVGKDSFLVSVDKGTGDSFFVGLTKSIVDNWIALAAERSGELLAKPVNWVLFKTWQRANPGKTMDDFFEVAAKTTQGKLMRQMGYHGWLTEIGEERIEELGKALVGLEEYQFPSGTQLLAEGVVFFVIGSPATAANIASSLTNKKVDTVGTVEAVKNLAENAKKAGVITEAVEDLIDRSTDLTGNKFVYVPAKTFNEEVAKVRPDGKTPIQVYEDLVDSQRGFNDKVNTGGVIKIPTHKLPSLMDALGPQNKMFQEMDESPRDKPKREKKKSPLEKPADPANKKEEGDIPETPVEDGGQPSTQEAKVTHTAPTSFEELLSDPDAVTPENQASVDKIKKDVEKNLRQGNLQRLKGLKRLRAKGEGQIAQWVAERYARRASIRSRSGEPVDPFELYKSESLTFVVDPGPQVSRKGKKVKVSSQRPGAKGKIEVTDSGVVITLFKDADISTIFHELGHLWLLEVQADVKAIQRIPEAERTAEQNLFIEDSNAILSELGLNRWGQLGRAHSEVFAKKAEAFVFKGEVSNKRLRPIMQRFMAWMRKVYSNFKAIGVRMSPQFKDVMDRLVSAPDVVSAAQSRTDPEAFFGDASGLSEEQKKKWLEHVREAREKAELDFGIRYLKNVRRRETKKWKGINEEVKEELSEIPVYVAFSLLTTGKLPDGSAPKFVQDLSSYKLNRKEIIEQHGKEFLERLPKSAVSDKGVSASDIVDHINSILPASAPKYTSGHELMESMAQLLEQETSSHPQRGELVDMLGLLDSLKAESAELSAVKGRIKKNRGKQRKELKALFKQQIDSDVAFLKEMLAFVQAGEVIESAERKEIGVITGEDLPDADVENIRIEEQSKFLKNAIKEKNGQRAKADKEAIKIADRASKKDFDRLVSNMKQQEDIRSEIKDVRKELSIIRRSVEKTGQINAIADRITDSRYQEAEPIVRPDEDIIDEGIRAVHNRARSQLLRAELEILGSEHYATAKGLRALVDRKPKALEEYEEEARAEIMEGTARELNPFEYEKEMNRAAENARKHRDRDLQKAFEWKEIELRAHNKFRVAKEIQRQVDKGVKKVRRAAEKDVQRLLTEAGDKYVETVKDIHRVYEFVKRPEDTGKRKIERSDAAREWYARQVADGISPVIPSKILDREDKKNFQDVPLTELMDVFDSVNKILAMAKTKVRILVGREERDFNSVVDSLESQVKKAQKKGPVRRLIDRRRRHRLSAKARSFAMSFRDIAGQMKDLDRGQDIGVFTETLLFPLDQALSDYQILQADNFTFMSDLWKKTFPKAEHTLQDETYIPELGTSMTKEQMLAVVLNWGTMRARRKMIASLNAQLRPGSQSGKLIDAAAVQNGIINKLSKEEMDFVQAIFNRNKEKFLPLAQNLSKKYDGVSFDPVPSAAIPSPHGVYEGGYYPIKYDPIIPGETEVRKENVEDAAKDVLSGGEWRMMSPPGYLKAVTQSRGRIIRLDLDVANEYWDNLSFQVTHFEPVVNFKRLWEHPKVAKAIQETYSEERWTEASLWLDRLMRRYKNNKQSELSSYLRRGVQTSVLTLNLGVTLIQPFGIINAKSELGAKWLAVGIGHYIGDAAKLKRSRTFITSMSDMMKFRHESVTREHAEIALRKIRKGKVRTFNDKMDIVATAPTIAMQGIADDIVWMGAFLKARHDLGYGNASFDETTDVDEKAVKIADRAVINTQGSGRAQDLPRIMTETEFKRWMSLFGTFSSSRLNVFLTSIAKKKAAGPAGWIPLISDFMVMYPVQAALIFLLKELGRGILRDKELTRKERNALFKDFLLSVAMETPFNDMMFIRELNSAAMHRAYRGPAAAKPFLDFADMATQIKQWEFDKTLVLETLDVAGVIFHLPSGQLRKIVNGAVEMEKGKVGPGGLLLGPGPNRRR